MGVPTSPIRLARSLRLAVLPMLLGARPAPRLLSQRNFVGRQSDYLDFLCGTLAPFFRASESPIAIACFLLLTIPPLPPLPERRVPRFLRRMAARTDLLAAFPYLAIGPSSAFVQVTESLHTRIFGDNKQKVSHHSPAPSWSINIAQPSSGL